MTKEEIKESIRRGLKQKATIYRGSFAKYVQEDFNETQTVTDIVTKYLK